MSRRISHRRIDLAVQERLRFALRRKRNYRERQGRVEELCWLLKWLRDPKHDLHEL